MKKRWRQGEHYVWFSGAAVCLTLLMVAVLLGVVMVNGLGYFWPSDLALATLDDGSRLLGAITNAERVPDRERDNLQFKVGNRDLYGEDFRWIDGAAIADLAYPSNAVLLERVEFGNFHGFLKSLALVSDDLAAPGDDWSRLMAALPLVAQRQATVDEMQGHLAELNGEIESLRRQAARLRFDDERAHAEAIHTLQDRMEQLAQRFEGENAAIARTVTELRRSRATFRDAEGREKQIVLADIVRAVRPNAMSVWAKTGFYASKVLELLTDEPRESNTEGGLFPAIFGTVMMVMIMSIFALPMGVVTAVYLREYAREGLLVRLVRIAVYNLAGVPSIVFGVVGLGFFVYGVGSALDVLFFPERLPTPTFGTGGILWASLTLSLLTVPVVIVATEEGLSAIPRGLREASLALGATRFQTLVRVVMPMAVPGIITGFILAVARAAGEVAPLMITGVVKLAPALPIDGNFPYVHLERKFMHLGFHIYDVGFQSPNVEAAKPMVYITTLLLVVIVMVLSLTAVVLRNQMRKRFQSATF